MPPFFLPYNTRRSSARHAPKGHNAPANPNPLPIIPHPTPHYSEKSAS